MRINNNLMAMNTHRMLGINNDKTAKSIEKLSSGYRINRAGDDAAGLAISEKMRAQIRGLDQASRNSQDGISLVQTAEGALNETQAILQRMRELAVQSANDTNVNTDRDALQNEINELTNEITRIADTTEFNTQDLLNGSLDDVVFQVGANESQEVKLSIGDMRANALNVVSESVTIGDKGDAIDSIVASDDFGIDGAEITAVQGGAVGAEMEADAAGVSTDGYAKDITFTHSQGVTNAGNVTFDGANSISLDAGADIPWDDIVTSGGAATNHIVIAASGDKLTVDINVSGSGGDAQFSIADSVDANADGSYSYTAHGISFDLTADDFTNLNGNDIEIELANVTASGTSVDFTGGIDTASNTNQTLSGGASATFSGGGVALDATDADWLGGDSIEISGTGLGTSGGAITVKILSGAVELSNDVYTISGDALHSGVGTATTFAYDQHGISFNLDVGSATAFDADHAIESFDESATLANTAYSIDVTDDGGNDVTVAGSFAAGEYGLQEIADELNTLADAAGTFAGDFATVADGTITLNSAYTGTESEINVTTAGGLSTLFSGTENGSDSSVDLTLTKADATTVTKTGVSASATSATFTDADGETATLTLEGYDTLVGVNVAEAFAASDISSSEAGIDISSQEAAANAITTVNKAINSVSDERAKLGAVQNRLEHTIKNLDTSAENLQASESRIRDVDMAAEMMKFTKNNILQQAAQSMLAQANQAPQGVLQLLR